jgi:hypothetical protein
VRPEVPVYLVDPHLPAGHGIRNLREYIPLRSAEGTPLLVDKLIIHKTFQPFRSDGVFEYPYSHGAKDDAKEECSQQGGARAESGVINKAQRRILVAGPEMDQIIKHIFSSSR